MEDAIDHRIQQDKEIIQSITQKEIQRLKLKNKISMLRNNRSLLTRETQATDSKGNYIPGQRKNQNMFVTQNQVVKQVMKRIKVPDDLEELSKNEAKLKSVKIDQPKSTDSVQEESINEGSDEECLLSSDDEEVDLEELPKLFKAQPVQGPTIVKNVAAKPKPQVQVKPHKPDEIDLALAEINKAEKRRNNKASAKAKPKSRGRTKKK